ncbi:MAG TPA: hypothetical protein VMU30_13040 [Bacteroidota bacterium]|nr:hypothetical protein [Bacteroidota bacterium]
MLHRSIRTTTPVKTSIIISALVLLLGVLVMAFGFFNNNSQFMYIGIFMTGLTSWAILTITITSQHVLLLSMRLTNNVVMKKTNSSDLSQEESDKE